jgi:hypothetical protein
MKKLFALLMLVLLFACSKEDRSDQTEFLFYIIETQEDVDEFNATKIFGNLEIDGEGIHDLSGLSTLTSVGAIVIQNTQLTNLNGLQNIQNLTGKVHLENNHKLEDVTALSNISTQIITLEVIENNALTDLTGLNIAEQADVLHIERMPVVNMDNFTNIKIINTIRFRYLHQLNSVEGLIGLESIENQLRLEGLSQLNSLEGFNNIQSLDIDLNFVNLHLDDFQGFDGLTTCRSINISNMSDLQTLSGFDSLEYVSGVINLSDCSGIVNFDGFPSLISTGGLTINNLYALSDFGNLSQLTSIENDLIIVENNSLTDFCDLQTLMMNDGLGGDYVVFNNAYNPTQQDIIDGNCSL